MKSFDILSIGIIYSKSCLMKSSPDSLQRFCDSVDDDVVMFVWLLSLLLGKAGYISLQVFNPCVTASLPQTSSPCYSEHITVSSRNNTYIS